MTRCEACEKTPDASYGGISLPDVDILVDLHHVRISSLEAEIECLQADKRDSVVYYHRMESAEKERDQLKAKLEIMTSARQIAADKRDKLKAQLTLMTGARHTATDKRDGA